MSDTRVRIAKGWAESPIGDILLPLEDGRTLHHGWSPQCETEPSPTEDDWGVLKTTAIQSGAFLPEHNKRLPSNLSARPVLEVKPGDIILTCAGPRGRCGVPCLVRATRRRLMISGKMYRFRVPVQYIDPRYLEGFLRSDAAQTEIDRMKTGISDSGLNLTHDRFRRLIVPIAPLAEQKRIVAEFEKQFTRLDSAIAALQRVHANLRGYRAAVLKSAVEGRLVPTEAELARRQGHSYEPASKLVKRILVERRTRWEAEQLAKFHDTGRSPTDDKWKTKYKEPEGPDTSELPNLPEGWEWVTAEQLSDETRAITYGVIKLGEPVPDGVPTLRSSDVRHLWLDLANVKKVSPTIAQNFRRTFLRGEELLITVRGTLGGIAVAPTTCRGFNISREVAMIALVDEELGPTLAFFIGSSPLQNWLTRRTKGIAYTGINIETLKQLPIPLPPKKELARISAEIERRLSIIEEIRLQVESDLKRAERVRRAILNLAFNGKLVPQDPTDESADILLERIRTEREESVVLPRRIQAKTEVSHV